MELKIASFIFNFSNIKYCCNFIITKQVWLLSDCTGCVAIMGEVFQLEEQCKESTDQNNL